MSDAEPDNGNIDPETGMPVNPLFPPKSREVKVMSKFQMKTMIAQDGQRVLILRFETGSADAQGEQEYLVFAVHGQDLINMYEYVKRVVYGVDKAPSYMS